jgi:putative hydrolase of the HAD superfamily
VGVKKPNPKVFNFALESANARKDNSIMIGDSLEADIQGALDVGLEVIHCVFDDVTATRKDLVSVKKLLEIKQYL